MRARALTALTSRRCELSAGIIRSWAEPSPLLTVAGAGVAAAAPGVRGGSGRPGTTGTGLASATAWAHKGKGSRSPRGLLRPGVSIPSLLPLPKAKMAGPGKDLGQQWS